MIQAKDIAVTQTHDAKDGGTLIRARLDLNNIRLLSAQSVNATWMKPGELVEITKRDCRRQIMNELYGELRNDFVRLEHALSHSYDIHDIPEVRKTLEAIQEKLNY